MAASAAPSQTRPAPPPVDQRAAPGHPGWSVDARSGCWIWNAQPRAGATVVWDGACSRDGRATGRGVREWRWEENGERWYSRYEGEYRGGKENGRGVDVASNGTRYEGEWRDGLFNGRGVWTFATTGTRIEGEFRDGKANGHGVMTFANGNRYEGKFRDDKRTGRGVFTFANGNRYEGDWRDDKANGRGVFTFANGNRYEGVWRDNCFRDGDRRAAIGPGSECP